MKKTVDISIGDLKKIVDGAKAFDLVKVDRIKGKIIDHIARRRVKKLARETFEKEGIEVPEDVLEIFVEWYKYICAKVMCPPESSEGGDREK